MSRWDGEDLTRNNPADKDPHPDGPNRDPFEEPPKGRGRSNDHPDHLTGKPDRNTDDAAGDD